MSDIFDEYISQQEPVNPTFCAGCSEELHAPFLVISPHRTYYDPPCEEWYCRKCSASNKAWSGLVEGIGILPAVVINLQGSAPA